MNKEQRKFKKVIKARKLKKKTFKRTHDTYGAKLSFWDIPLYWSRKHKKSKKVK